MKRGFTLLEVMLALAIFALAATAVLQIASGALSNQHVLEEKTVAGWVAETCETGNRYVCCHRSSYCQTRLRMFKGRY